MIFKLINFSTEEIKVTHILNICGNNNDNNYNDDDNMNPNYFSRANNILK